MTEAEILTPEALQFLEELHSRFGKARIDLLARRGDVQAKLDHGWLPDFLSETRSVREGSWKVRPAPLDLQDRRVEITGPVDRKMVINALNSGAKMYMADFEDSHAPTWQGTLEGQANLRDAVRRKIDYVSPEGKSYRLQDKVATLWVRPRGWHLEEKHLSFEGRRASGSLTDFGLFFFHNAKEMIARGTGPYFYLPKLESHLEARLWNDVFVFAQKRMGLPPGTIRATVLIETILAAFEMDEILYELRDHCVGLNCGRWDYIFSFIKKFRSRPEFVLPDRAQVTMNVHFLRSYSQLLIQTCHKRGAHAMGGMAAQIPIKNDPAANEAALGRVRADKEREVNLGHDGTWVAHPGLVPIASEVFDAKMKGPNQLHELHPEWHITAQDLLKVPSGEVTDAGIRANLRISAKYLDSWLKGSGCVPIENLMEDAATAEISRAQLWQWIKYGKTTREYVRKALDEECGGKFVEAERLLWKLITSDRFEEFLTLSAYEQLP